MSHEIMATDRFGLNLKNGRAWHGLGIDLGELATVREAFEKLGLNWKTELRKVYSRLPGNVIDGEYVPGREIEIEDSLAHFRTDTWESLGIVGKDYRPVPNEILAKFSDALVEADANSKVETGGSLRNGRRVFVLIRLGDPVRIVGEDALVPYLLITNCHDGSGALRAFFTTIRVVCANTHLWAESRAGNAGFWFRHDGDLEAKLAEARKILGFVHGQSKKASEEARAFSATSLVDPSNFFDDVYARTFGVRPTVKKTEKGDRVVEVSDEEQQAIGAKLLADALDSNEKVLDEAVEKYDAKKKLVVEAWGGNFERDPARGTLWGGVNAVTEYHDHQRGRGTPRERETTDARVHSNLFGVSSRDKQIAYAVAREIVRAR